MKLLENVNPEQKAAITHTNGPLLIVAGAGTGKTTVITQRIGWMIENHLAKSDEILALTFTEKAAEEMKERADKLLPYGYLDLWIHTFHSFCQRILESYGVEIGLPYNFKVLDETQAWILMHKNFSKFTLDYYKPLGNPTKFLHALIKNFSRLKDEAISPKEYLEFAQNVKLNTDSAQYLSQILSPDEQKKLKQDEIEEMKKQEILKVSEISDAYHVYQGLLHENHALDFGDLINYTLKLFKERPRVLAKFRNQFKYILVDEFQDTNWAQYELVKTLAHPENNLTVTGDDDQAVYKFRGASISNILQFKKDYPASQQVYLVKNYRTRQNILDLAYQFIQKNNPYRLEVTLQDGNGLTKKLEAQKSGEGKIEYVFLDSQEDEMKYVVKKILELKESDTEATWSDFAILVRANSHADIFNYGLSQAGIPYYYVASRGLYHKPVILDVVAWLKLLDNYHESPALFRILNLPFFEFLQREIVEMNYWARRKGRSLYGTLARARVMENAAEEFVKKCERVLNLIHRHSKLQGEKTVKEIILLFLEESGYLEYLSRMDSEENMLALSYLRQFYKKVAEYEATTPGGNLKDFLHLFELELSSGEEGALESEPEMEGPYAVRVMTMHAAKGLEFKYVFVVNLTERRFPSTARRDPIEIPDELIKEIIPTGDVHLQEERRLMYVAVTRAKHGIFFTGAKNYGGVRARRPSIFASELGLQPVIQAFSGLQDQKVSPKPDKNRYEHKMPQKFSFSQLKAFENCPWQYRYAFILKVPVKGRYTYSFGKTLHKVMQKVFQKIIAAQSSSQKTLFGEKEAETQKKMKEVASLKEILDIYQECFIDDWYENEEQKKNYFEKGKEILKSWHNEEGEKVFSPLYLEKSFSLRVLDDERGIEYSVFGVIDRVDSEGQGVEIIDYKTGKAKLELKGEDKEQLLIYQLAAENVLGKPVKKLSYHYLEGNIKQDFLGTEKDLALIQKKILLAIREIEKGAFPPRPSPLCKFCDFFDICEFRQS